MNLHVGSLGEAVGDHLAVLLGSGVRFASRQIHSYRLFSFMGLEGMYTYILEMIREQTIDNKTKRTDEAKL